MVSAISGGGGAGAAPLETMPRNAPHASRPAAGMSAGAAGMGTGNAGGAGAPLEAMPGNALHA